ncbi:DAGL [Mytilus coruscus]|uniref:sn-1-specific diacylglycerol lipase n=1 Tax=Mytilus coruscus TaxID=42192 RepID=A0A6J8B3Z7_MYTCO|nr:DAGL [Mytilus coruscus]
MPGLIAFGRKWGIGSDDFVFPGILEIFCRVIWLIFMSVVYNLHQDAFIRCTGGSYLQIYCIGILVVMCVCIISTCVIVFISSRGSIMNAQPRRKFVKVLYVRSVLAIVEIVWNILGSYWAFGMKTTCEHSVELAVKITVIVFWILAVTVFIAFLFVFGILGGSKKSHHEGLYSKESGASSSAINKWEKRFKIICCCLAGSEKNTGAFNAISQLLADYFKDVDLVPTDIAAGLILVHKDQEKQISDLPCISYDTFTNGAASRSNGQASTSTEECNVKPKPWMTTKMMFHYMRYASASYGWPFYIFTNLFTGICRLCKHMRCCSCCLPENQVHFDNCCQCNTATIKRLTGLDQFDLVYADYHNRIFEIPFYVAIDKEKQSVVVAIRGTLSLKDAITDMSADSECLECEGLIGCVAHKGILQAAQYVKKTLEEKHILEDAFDRAQGSKLVITGHSLGADQQTNNRKDMITRLSIWSMYDLKEKTLTAIRNSHSPKFRTLASGAWEVLCGCFISDSTATERLLGRGVTNIGNNDIEEALQNVSMAREKLKITHPPMYPPGQILHVLEVEGGRACCGTPSFYAEWSRAEDFVKEIILSPDMVTDHIPDNLMTALEQLSDKDFTPKQRKSQEEESCSADSTPKLEFEQMLKTMYGRCLQLPVNYIIPKNDLQSTVDDSHASTKVLQEERQYKKKSPKSRKPTERKTAQKRRPPKSSSPAERKTAQERHPPKSRSHTERKTAQEKSRSPTERKTAKERSPPKSKSPTKRKTAQKRHPPKSRSPAEIKTSQENPASKL